MQKSIRHIARHLEVLNLLAQIINSTRIAYRAYTIHTNTTTRTTTIESVHLIHTQTTTDATSHTRIVTILSDTLINIDLALLASEARLAHTLKLRLAEFHVTQQTVRIVVTIVLRTHGRIVALRHTVM